MMKNFIALLFLLTSPLVFGSTFNFQELADSNTPMYGAQPGEYGSPSMSFKDGSLSLEATAYGLGGEVYNPYLDRGNAGLGVCKVLDRKSQCTPSNDDNVTYGETLLLEFSDVVSIDEITFRNGSHQTSFNGYVDINIDGKGWNSHLLTYLFTGDMVGQSFEFRNLNLYSQSSGSQFYMSNIDVTAVPLPPAIWLFFTGILAIVRFSGKDGLIPTK